MFKPLAVYIGLRYTRAKKKNHFVSFISLSSMLGIGLGVMVLITVLSVMNGFDEEIHKRFFGMAPEVTISGPDGRLSNWQELLNKVKSMPQVLGVAPYVVVQGLMTYDGQVVPIILTGILPEYETQVTALGSNLITGNLSQLNNFGIIIGKGLADTLGLMIDDRITVMTPQASITPAGVIPRFKRFIVKGVFSVGVGFSFDTKLAFINLYDAQKLMQYGDDVSGIKLKLADIYQAVPLTKQLLTMLPEGYQVGNWTDQFGPFFKAVKMEKTMMFLILILIIAVAAFNLISSLVMVVNDKRAEIAILRTIGATPAMILWIFIVQGMMVGVVGTVLGVIGGLILANNATVIVNTLQAWMHVKILSANIYFVDSLPAKILWQDLWKVTVVAITMSFIATIYPAYRASRTEITEALYNE